MNQASNGVSKPILSPSFILKSLGIQHGRSAPSNDARAFSGVITDSRKIQPNCLFLALEGENFDGHAFIDTAVSQEARGVVCRKNFAFASREKKDLWIFEVEDTLEAYRKLGGAWRALFNIPVICVAGSVGKTTTKELLTAILMGKWSQVLKTQGSQNGFVGIPMTLLELRPDHQAAVVEVGIDEPGTMIQHLELTCPTRSLVTAIGPEHLEKLVDLPTIAREESLALSWVAQSRGTDQQVVVQLDDPWLRPYWDSLPQNQKLGCTLSAQVQAEAQSSGSIFRGEIESASNRPGQEMSALLVVNGPNFHQEKFPLPLPGLHNARNLLGAITVAAGLGLTADEIRAGLAGFKGAEGRSQVRELPGPFSVICDYYNAQPASMEAGLDLLAQLAPTGQRRRWACLGDMLEMGESEERLHRELATQLIRLKIENVLLYGPRMRFLENELKQKNFPFHVSHFETHAEMAQALCTGIQPGEAILIKGSRGMRMEEVWKRLTAHIGAYAQDTQRLS